MPEVEVCKISSACSFRGSALNTCARRSSFWSETYGDAEVCISDVPRTTHVLKFLEKLTCIALVVFRHFRKRFSQTGLLNYHSQLVLELLGTESNRSE